MVEEMGQDAVTDTRSSLPDIEADYFDFSIPLKTVCERHGLTESKLKYIRKKNGWPLRVPRNTTPQSLVTRLFVAFDGQLARFENSLKPTQEQENAAADKGAAVLASMTRTLQKLIALEIQQKGQKREKAIKLSDLQVRLAQRLEELRRR